MTMSKRFDLIALEHGTVRIESETRRRAKEQTDALLHKRQARRRRRITWEGSTRSIQGMGT